MGLATALRTVPARDLRSCFGSTENQSGLASPTAFSSDDSTLTICG
jgi:hypothetical protein